jgi:hypothetical protein
MTMVRLLSDMHTQLDLLFSSNAGTVKVQCKYIVEQGIRCTARVINSGQIRKVSINYQQDRTEFWKILWYVELKHNCAWQVLSSKAAMCGLLQGLSSQRREECILKISSTLEATHAWFVPARVICISRNIILFISRLEIICTWHMVSCLELLRTRD